MNIQNRIIEIVNDYDYEKEVEECVKFYEQNSFKEGEIISLYPSNISDEFEGDEEEIAQKVAKQIIQYRIKEKTFIKLMSKGIIHPVGVRDGSFRKNVVYKNVSGMTRSALDTSVYFPISIFMNFMKV
ncbi:Uncharacterised protein [[Clostridium] sordellii]|uniref:hypothetical protein n=1 Tax=Paraclostridium sordellii TaxID=1505 RepID=UPI0005E19C70|nr:hypothetical protein [Paeniclostridium sordellii]CEO04843.1 Uncharacterised protein [[Clostridium] sordellii] [Paeniclostridium sordellii]